MKFWSFANYQATLNFLDQSVWICKWVSWWCHRLTIFHSFCTQNLHKFHIQLWECYTCLNYSLNRCRLMLTPIYWYEGHTLTSLGKILKFSKLYVQNIRQVVRWWHHQLTYSFAYSYGLVKKCFLKICETSKCRNFLIFVNQFSSGFHCFVQNFSFFLKLS